MLSGAPWPPCLESRARTEESSLLIIHRPWLVQKEVEEAPCCTQHTCSGTKAPPGGRDGSPDHPGTQALIILESSEVGPHQGSTRGSLGTTAPSAAPRQQGWEASLAQTGTLPSHPNGPSPLPLRLTRAEGNPVQMGRLNPGSLGSVPLPSASPCHLPTSRAGLPSCLLGAPASAAP